MTSTHTSVRIFAKCAKLKDMDTFSKSDPYVVLYEVTGGRKRLVGKTEVIKDNLNPNFKTAMAMTYFFEYLQNMRVEVWDKDSGKNNDDFLGGADFTMGQLMSGRDSAITLPLLEKGTVTLSGIADGAKKGFVALMFRGKDLKKMDFFSKSDPYFFLRRVLPNGQRVQVYKSEVIDNTLNPQWKATRQIDIQELCGGDLVSPCIEFACYDEDLTSDDPMGTFLVSGEQLLTGTGEYELTMVSKKGKTKSYGFICLDRCDFLPIPSFTDFLKYGMQLNIAFSIDFTGSNGPPSDPRSLHFYSPTQPNHYIRAMLAVSNVVQEYDSDRQFPAFGFGAVAPFTQGTSHFFPLNGNPQNAYCNGMQQVIDTYAALLPVLRFSGPTNFAPTIAAMTEGARQVKGVYTILMILTDGAITDMQDTIDTIVAADDAPLSIIIIGIGNADFSSMDFLDGDGKAIKGTSGRKSRRDLVQFVPFNRFEGRDPSLLAAAVLMEIPRQVEMWGFVSQTSV